MNKKLFESRKFLIIQIVICIILIVMTYFNVKRSLNIRERRIKLENRIELLENKISEKE